MLRWFIKESYEFFASGGLNCSPQPSRPMLMGSTGEFHQLSTFRPGKPRNSSHWVTAPDGQFPSTGEFHQSRESRPVEGSHASLHAQAPTGEFHQSSASRPARTCTCQRSLSTPVRAIARTVCRRFCEGGSIILPFRPASWPVWKVRLWRAGGLIQKEASAVGR
jgi:hypothetical protein